MKKILFLLAILTFSTEILGQSSFGFRYQLMYAKSESSLQTTYDGWSYYNLFFSFSHKFKNNIGVNSRLGILLPFSSYGGFDLGIYSEYYILDELFLLGGVNLHENIGSVHMNYKVKEKLIPFFVIGTGYKYKNTIWEISWQIPTEKNPLIVEYDYLNEKKYISQIVVLNIGLEF